MRVLVAALVVARCSTRRPPRPAREAADLLRTDSRRPGRPGGRLVFALRSEPKTLNPVTSVDSASRDVIGRLTAKPDPASTAQRQRTAPALARAWTVSTDGLRYVARAAPRPALLGRPPVRRRRRGLQLRVLPRRAQRVAAARPADRRRQADRRPQARRHTGSRWRWSSRTRWRSGSSTASRSCPGIGWRRRRRRAGWPRRGGCPPRRRRWRARGPSACGRTCPGSAWCSSATRTTGRWTGTAARLPYLDEIVFLLVPSEDAEVLRFKAGETDLISRMSADNFAALARRSRHRATACRTSGPGSSTASCSST